jgi:hypothetical protein
MSEKPFDLSDFPGSFITSAIIADGTVSHELTPKVADATIDGANFYLLDTAAAPVATFSSEIRTDRQPAASVTLPLHGGRAHYEEHQAQVLGYTDANGNARLPDHLIGQTPPGDLRRFLAATQRKVEEVQKAYPSLLLEAHTYPGINDRHLNIARHHMEIGLMFLEKALRDVEITDDGK